MSEEFYRNFLDCLEESKNKIITKLCGIRTIANNHFGFMVKTFLEESFSTGELLRIRGAFN